MKQITEIDLYQTYCEKYHADQNLLLINNTGEAGYNDGVIEYPAEAIVRLHLSKFQIDRVNQFNSSVLIYTLKEKDIFSILSLAHDSKWDWGWDIYIWHKNKILWGKGLTFPDCVVHLA